MLSAFQKVNVFEEPKTLILDCHRGEAGLRANSTIFSNRHFCGPQTPSHHRQQGGGELWRKRRKSVAAQQQTDGW